MQTVMATQAIQAKAYRESNVVLILASTLGQSHNRHLTQYESQ